MTCPHTVILSLKVSDRYTQTNVELGKCGRTETLEKGRSSIQANKPQFEFFNFLIHFITGFQF